MSTYEIIMAVLAVLFGGLSVYLKTNNKVIETKKTLQEKVTGYISDAESAYSDATKSGGQKREWVIDKLYALVPSALKPFFSRELLEEIVQNAFDAIQSFATQQLNKAIDKVIPNKQDVN